MKAPGFVAKFPGYGGTCPGFAAQPTQQAPGWGRRMALKFPTETGQAGLHFGQVLAAGADGFG